MFESLITVPTVPTGIKLLGMKKIQQRRGFRGDFCLPFPSFPEVAGTLEPRGIPMIPVVSLLRRVGSHGNETVGNLRSEVVGKGGRS